MSRNKKYSGSKGPRPSKTVSVPAGFAGPFLSAEKIVGDYFRSFSWKPEKGTIEIGGERYVLIRASALSHEFLEHIAALYGNRDAGEAERIGKNMLFDLAHMIGYDDALAFHKKMKVTDPIDKLSAGPVHFAWSGWAFVDILPESNPSPDQTFFLKYHHPFSFEADSWISSKKKSGTPVCIMNAGYSSGWCEASFGIPLTAVELTCRACGDEHCTFVMAQPARIKKILKKHSPLKSGNTASYPIPAFMERKKAEEKLKQTVREKEVMLQEIHHRVKNNLQIISSLLNLQAGTVSDGPAKNKFYESIRRIRSIALIHELLYRSQDFSLISLQEYFSGLTREISNSYMGSSKARLIFRASGPDARINLDKAIPCGLIVHELISNAHKHAFGVRKNGVIRLGLKVESIKGKKRITIIVSDDGKGLNPDAKRSDSLGMDLVESLCGQINASFKTTVKKGTRHELNFIS
jgi:two-component sensor histidine kinase